MEILDPKFTRIYIRINKINWLWQQKERKKRKCGKQQTTSILQLLISKSTTCINKKEQHQAPNHTLIQADRQEGWPVWLRSTPVTMEPIKPSDFMAAVTVNKHFDPTWRPALDRSVSLNKCVAWSQCAGVTHQCCFSKSLAPAWDVHIITLLPHIQMQQTELS